ncbi:TPA: hypothetical protein IBI80_002056 [Escherichia coli]|nr:hypothetical protein [Escherichia coli]
MNINTGHEITSKARIIHQIQLIRGITVISSAGNSRSVYPVMTSALHNSSWKFYARMQKIDPALDVISGQVMSHILVDVYYE